MGPNRSIQRRSIDIGNSISYRSTCREPLLKVVQTTKRSHEVFGIVKSCAEAAQRTLERKILNLEMTKVHALKFSSVYRCFGRYQTSLQVGGEDGVPNQLKTNRETSPRKTRHRPIPGVCVKGRADRGYRTARADTKLFLLLPVCFPCSFSLQQVLQSSAKIQTELPVAQPYSAILSLGGVRGVQL